MLAPSVALHALRELAYMPMVPSTAVMVDLHHHLLPGLDDGSPDLQTSVAMAQIAVSDGISHVVCTPHASGRFAFEPESIAERMDALRSALQAQSIPLTLAAGCDFHLSFDNIEDALASPQKYTIAGHSYLLVELPDFGLPPGLGETFYELRLAGMTPILTHPERNPTLQKDAARLEEWMRAGLLLQVTAGSLTGHMGKTAQRMAEDLLKKRWVHFLATDAHNTGSRPPRMSAARDLVARKYSASYAALLCNTNPMAVFEGRPLPEQPGTELFTGDDEQPKTSVWKRLFSR